MRRWWKQMWCRHDWRSIGVPGGIERAMSAQAVTCCWCGKTGVLR